MEMVVFAEQFNNGNWGAWKHVCSPEEGAAILDCALARARVRSSRGRPNHDDFLQAARGMLNSAQDPALNPEDGDIRVYCVCVDKIVIGEFEKIRQYSQGAEGSQEFVKVAMEEPAYGLDATTTATFA